MHRNKPERIKKALKEKMNAGASIFLAVINKLYVNR